MYKSMMDESGLNPAKEKVCVVVGFVGSVDEWSHLDELWQAVLDKSHIDVFHALHFWYRDNRGRRHKDYDGWDVDKDLKFVNGLINAITESKIRKVGAATISPIFMKLSKDERRWLTTGAILGKDWESKGKPDDPYYFVFQDAILYSAKLVPDGDVLYPFFDMKDSPEREKKPLESKAREIYAEILGMQPPVSVRAKLGDGLAFASKAKVKGLQAADFLANRTRVYVAKGLGDGPVADSIREFVKIEKENVRLFDYKGLDAVLRGCPFRSTFWESTEFEAAKPDFVEKLRVGGEPILATKGFASGGNYHSHFIDPGKFTLIGQMEVSSERTSEPVAQKQQVQVPTTDTEKPSGTSHNHKKLPRPKDNPE